MLWLNHTPDPSEAPSIIGLIYIRPYAFTDLFWPHLFACITTPGPSNGHL